MIAIRTRGLSKRFGAVAAVTDLELEVPSGCVFGFLGPNGAGKTTTIRLLLGLLRPGAGTIELNGRPLAADRCRALAGVGAIVETPALYGNLTGREHLRMATLTHRGSREEIEPLARLVGLSGALDRTVGRYSLGMRQRLALARALLGRPELLILDEPTNGLDPSGMAEFRDLLVDLPARFDTTVFLSSHLLGEIEHVASRCAVLKQGRLVFQGEVTALRNRLTPLLEIHVEDGPRLREEFERRGEPTTMAGSAVRVANPGAPGDRAALLAELVASGHRVSEFRLLEPSLEQVFLELTRESG